MKVRFTKEMDGPGGVRHPVGREVDHPLMTIHMMQGNAEPVDEEAIAWWEARKKKQWEKRLAEQAAARQATEEAIDETRAALFGDKHDARPGDDSQRGGSGEGGSGMSGMGRQRSGSGDDARGGGTVREDVSTE